MRILLTGSAAILLGSMLACGNPPAAAKSTQMLTPAPMAMASPPPPGGEVPVELRGLWLVKGSSGPPQFSTMKLTANGEQFLQGSSAAVVNGSEIDFYGSSSCDFTDAVGRYRWTLVGDELHFDSLNDDPCDRHIVFSGTTFVLIKHLP